MNDPLLESFLLLAVGLTGVAASLALFAGTIWLLRSTDERWNAFRIRRYARKLEVTPPVDEVNDELVAVLTAAAIGALRKPVRIRRMRFLDTRTGAAWATTGRLNIMASHAIARRKT